MATATKAPVEDVFAVEETAGVPSESYPDYGTLLENLTRDLAVAQEDERAARSESHRMLAAIRVEQFRLAIRNAEAAQRIPAQWQDGQWVAAAVQFDMDGRSGTVRIPPALDEFKHVFPAIRYRDWRWITTNPLEIAWLRSQGRSEVPLGHVYARPKEGVGDGMWVSQQQFDLMVKNGMAQ